jgi:hypothetical protein
VNVLLLAALLTLTSPQAPQDTVNIEGRVLRAGSQDPIPNVQITLIKSSAGTSPLTAETAAALDSLQQLVSSAPRGISHAYLDALIASREQTLGLAPGTFALTTTGRLRRSPTLRDILVSRITRLEHTEYVHL